MKYPRTAEGYSEYIKGEHWDKLRSCVLERDGNRCVLCGSGERLQAHHKFYRADWEQAQPSDLITLCKVCHEKQHPEKHIKTEAITLVPVEMAQTEARLKYLRSIDNPNDLLRARTDLLITREEYRQRMREFGIEGWVPRKWNKKKHKWQARKKKAVQGCKPWFYSPRRMHWTNRGSSSN